MDFDISTLLTGENMLDPITYQYFHQLIDNRTIVFNDFIGSDIVEKIYLPLRDFEKDDSVWPVTMIINSCGGSVSDGFFLAHYISQYSKKLNIIVTGNACSMATVILAAGGKNKNVTRYCYPSSYSLIHDGFIAFEPQESKTAQDIMNFNDKVDKDIRQFFLDNTNITAEEYDANTRKQWFLSADDMLKYNLVDKIIGVNDNGD